MNFRILADYTKRKTLLGYFLLKEPCFRILSMKSPRCTLLIDFGSHSISLFTLISCPFLSHKKS